MGIGLYFLLTLLLELPLILVWQRKQWGAALLVGFLLNLFTWPTLVILIQKTSWSIPVMEIGVALVEGFGYWLFFRNPWWQAIGMGILVNAISYGAGLLLFS